MGAKLVQFLLTQLQIKLHIVLAGLTIQQVCCMQGSPQRASALLLVAFKAVYFIWQVKNRFKLFDQRGGE